MAQYTIESELLKATIDSKGCELVSVIRKETDTEYLWQADPAVWKRHSPVLFPLVGKLKNDTYLYEDSHYHMSQHGFARDMEFELISLSKTKIRMRLSHTPETYEQYPFQFELICAYELQEDCIDVGWEVYNQDSKELYYSIGAHPAFACPKGASTMAETQIAFDTKEDLNYHLLNQDGLVDEKDHRLESNQGKIDVTEALFAKDALIFEEGKAHTVALLYEGKPFIQVAFAAPVFGLWSPPGKNLPFLCIEPWYGRADGAQFNASLSEREWGNVLKPGKNAEYSYEIQFL